MGRWAAKSGRVIALSSLKLLLVVPGKPSIRMLEQVGRVFFKDGQVLEGIYTAKIAGMNDAHVEISDVCAMERLVEKRVTPVANGHF